MSGEEYCKIGERAGAILYTDSNARIVRFAGYGIYRGEQVPDPGITFMGQDMHKLARDSPRIDLDNGKTIWGCQCWWGPEQKIKDMLEFFKWQGYKIETADPGEYAPKLEKTNATGKPRSKIE